MKAAKQRRTTTPVAKGHFDQTPDFDPTQPNPVPDFEFDQSRDG